MGNHTNQFWKCFVMLPPKIVTQHCSGALLDCSAAPRGFPPPGVLGKQHGLAADGLLLEAEEEERAAGFLP